MTTLPARDASANSLILVHDLLHPQVKAPPGGEVVVVGESFGWPQAKIPQPNLSRVITEAGTTDVADAVLATLDDEPVLVAYPSNRR